MKKITLLLSILMISISSFSQSTIYLSASGDDDSNDGLSSGSPVETISKAKGLAGDGGTIIIDGNGGAFYIDSQFNCDFGQSFEGINDAVIEGWNSGGPRMFNLNVTGKTVTFKNLTIQNMTNTSNGNVFNMAISGTTLNLENCVFLKNGSSAKGGVLAMTGGSTLSIKSCIFDGDGAELDGGVPAVGVQGGALFINNAAANVTITNSTFRKFTVNNKGGAFFVTNVDTFKGVNLTIADNENTATAAGAAAGVHFQAIQTSAELQNCILVNNTTGSAITPITDISSATTPAPLLSISNSLVESVTNGVKNLSDLADVSNNNVFGNEAGVGSPVIDGWAFNSGTNVYEYTDASYPVLWGEVSFLTDMVDQLGTTRTAVDGNIDAGAWQSSHANQKSLAVESFELLESGFAVYPNPVSSRARIVAPTADAEIVEIYSVIGQKVLEVKVVNGEADLDVQNLKTGIYIAKMAVGNRNVVQRFVVTK